MMHGISARRVLRSNRARLLAAVGAATAFVSQVHAQTSVFWDINGATAGAGGTGPAGTWDTTSLNWNTSAAGSNATQVWADGNTAIFAAGSDATGNYTITVSGARSAAKIAEGATNAASVVTISGGTSMTLVTAASTAIPILAGGTSGGLVISTPVMGTAGFIKGSAGPVTLTNTNSISGPVSVNFGALNITGSAGTMQGISSWNINQFGTLNLINSSANNNDRLLDTASVTSSYGQFNYSGSSGTNSQETVGTLTISPGTSIFTVVSGNTTAGSTESASVNLGSLAHNVGGTVLFRGTSMGTLAPNTGAGTGAAVGAVLVSGSTSAVGGGGASGTSTINIIPFALVESSATAGGGGGDFATYDANFGIRKLASTEYKTGITDGQTQLDNVVINGTNTLAAASTTVNALKFTGTNTLNIGASSTLNLNSGGIFAASAASGTINGGTLSTAGELIVQAQGSLTIGATLSATSLTKAGPGNLILNGTNNFTGNTYVNGGTLTVGNAAALGTSPAIILGITQQGATTPTFNGILALNNAAGMSLPQNVTLSATQSSTAYSPGDLQNIAGNNTIAGTITLGGYTTTGVVSTNLGDTVSIINVSSGTSLTLNGQILQGTAPTAGDTPDNAFYKTGPGTLILKPSSASTYTGIVRVFEGGVVAQSNGAFGTSAGGVFELSPFTSSNASQAKNFVALQATGTAAGLNYSTTETLSLTGWGPSATAMNLNAWANSAASSTITFAGAISLANPLEFTQWIDPTMINVDSGVTFRATGAVTGSSTTSQRSLYKWGNGSLQLSGAASTFSGPTYVQQGTLSFIGAGVVNPVFAGVNIIHVAPGAVLEFNNSTSVNTNRIGDNVIQLENGEFRLVGNATNAATQTINSGKLIGFGQAYLTVSSAASATQMIVPSDFLKNGSTLLVRGQQLGGTPGSGITNISFSSAPALSGIGALNSQQAGIVNFAVGDTSTTGNGSGFVTYDTNGFRLLNGSESTAFADGDFNQSNANVAGAQQVMAGGLVNSLRFTAAGDMTIDPTATLQVASGAILNAAGSAIQINGGTLNFGSTGYITTKSNSFLTIGSTITGSSGITKSGNGDLTVNGSNTFTGPVTINAGNLIASDETNLGDPSNNLVINGGALEPTSSYTGTSRAMEVNGRSGGFNVGAGQTFTVSSNIGGSGALFKSGTGTLVLTGTNSFTQGLFINGGTVEVNGDAATGSSSLGTGMYANQSASISIDGGTLQYDNDTTVSANRILWLGYNNATISVAANKTVDMSNVFWAGPGAFIKDGAGKMIMGSYNGLGLGDWLGPIEIKGGILAYNAANAFSYTTAGTVNPNYWTIDDGATLQVNITDTAPGFFGIAYHGITINGNATLDLTKDENMLQAISGNGSLTKTGAGNVTFGGVSTFSGPLSIEGGLLSSGGADSHLGAVPSVATPGSIIIGNATFRTGAQSVNANRGVRLDDPNSTWDTTGNTTYSGIIAGTGSLNKTGTGTLILGGVSTFSSGIVNISGGAITVNKTNALPTGSVVNFAAASSLNVNQDQTLAGITGASGTITNTTTTLRQLTVNNSSDGTYDGVITATLALTKNGSGKLTLTGTNSYTGNTTVTAGTLVADDGSLGSTSNTVVLNGGTLASNSGLTTSRNLTVNSTGGNLDGTNGGISVSGAGNTTLNGNLTVAAGTVTFNRSGGTVSVGASGAMTVKSGATLNLQGTAITSAGGNNALINDNGVVNVSSNHTISAIRGSGSLAVNAGNLAIAPTLVGGISVGVKGDNAGTSVLSALSIATGAGASMDLGNHSLIVNYTPGNSPATTIKGYLANAYNAGAWNQPGLTSSVAAADTNANTALGYAEASDLGLDNGHGSFAGQTVAGEAVLVKYTYYGDSNLDGVVNLDDFSIFIDGFNHLGSGWIYGDYNYDGNIDQADFAKFVQGYNITANNGPSLSQLILSDSELSASQKSALLSVVPEPTSLGIFAIGAGAMAMRRRRKM